MFLVQHVNPCHLTFSVIPLVLGATWLNLYPSSDANEVCVLPRNAPPPAPPSMDLVESSDDEFHPVPENDDDDSSCFSSYGTYVEHLAG